jgi:hypothetical protein
MMDWRRIDRAVEKFETQSALSLFASAADSPSCAHRLPSLTLLWSRALAQEKDGNIVAEASHLDQLLELVHKTQPRIMRLEDTWTADPRLTVRHRIGSERLRIHPGAVSDPAQLLRTMGATALAIDDFVLDQHEFTFSDLLESALRYSDWILSQVADSWPTGPLERDRLEPIDEDLEARARRIATSPAVLQQGELEIRRTISTEPMNWLSKCSNLDRATKAWKWATSDSRSTRLTFTPGTSHIGPSVAFTRGGRVHSVPAALVLDGLMSAHLVLAHEAAGDEHSRRLMSLHTIGRTLEILGIEFPSHETSQSESESRSNDGQGQLEFGVVVRPGGLHSFDIGIASGLSETQLCESVDIAHRVAERVAIEGSTVSPTIPGSDEYRHRIVVYGGPIYLKPASKPGPTQIHVEDLAMIKFESQQMVHGHDLLFQFLDELTTMPGLHEFHFVEFSDIWRHWKLHGALNFTGMTDIDFMVDIRQNEDCWATAAAWEPIEVVLADSGLPSVWSWSNVYLKDENQALLVAPNASQYSILVDPPIVIRHEIQSDLVDMGIDPAFITGIVDGLVLTVKNFPGISRATRVTSQRPLRIDLSFVGERHADASDDVIVFGAFTSNDSGPLVSIQLGPDWFESLNDSPEDAHLGLGQTLFHCLTEIHESEGSEGWANENSGFLIEWQAAPPVAMLRFQQTPLRARNMGQDSLPRTVGSLGRARRAFAVAVVESGAPIGSYRGSTAIDICKEVIAPAWERALNNFMAPWSAESIIEIATHLNDAHAERARSDASLTTALSAPWEKNWRVDAMNSPDPSEMTRPLELLLELSMARGTFGTVTPDRFAIAEATDLALIGLNTGAALSGATKGLHDLSVAVRAGGVCGVTGIPLSVGRNQESREDSQPSNEIDVEAFMRVRRLNQLRLRSTLSDPEVIKLRLGQNPLVTTSPFAAFDSLEVPASLAKADKAMLETCGTGFNGIFAVLSTAGSWTSAEDRVEVVPLSSLRQEASSWASIPLGEIDSALDRLMLGHSDLLQEGVRYWEIENRRMRLSTRPLVQIGSDVVLIPWLIDATKRVYTTYILDGRLPWHEDDTPDRVKQELNNYRTIQNRLLEKEAESKVTTLRMPNAFRILPNRCSKFGLSIPGEIDLIVADVARARMWVCEIKDVHSSFSASRMQRRVEKYTKRKSGIFDKLDSRFRAISANIYGALKMLGVSLDVDSDWTVIPVIITREVEPAAFIPNVSVAFCLLDDLEQLLALDDQPSRGYGWMTHW